MVNSLQYYKEVNSRELKGKESSIRKGISKE